MKHPERGKLIPVSGNQDTPDLENAVDVQFNPTSLKVSLANTLDTGEQGETSRAAQYIASSSSGLTVELVFDTTLDDPFVEQAREKARQQGDHNKGADLDVRLITRRIAERFMKPVPTGDREKDRPEAPSRCLFQWGAFEFVGLVERYDETLTFFSPEGTPLRATLSLALKEDSYQFRNRAAEQAAKETPSFSPTGNAGEDSDSQDPVPVAGGSDNQPGNWRDNALFNGTESPRLPSGSVLARPGQSPAERLGLDLSAGGGIRPGFSSAVSPGFRFGNSALVGTGIEGAFGHSLSGQPGASLCAEGIRAGNQALRGAVDRGGVGKAAQGSPFPPAPGDSGVGFN
jgi:hypothetical protein